MFLYVLVVLCSSSVIIQCFGLLDEHNTVQTPVGNITGFNSYLPYENASLELKQFLGILYAEPQSGARRFAKPVPKATFKSPFSATKFGDACLQLQFPQVIISENTTYSEDCLSLNIYVPGNVDTQSVNDLYPVMIFIHGGGFIVGSSETYDARYLSAVGNVIVVTINYRLGQPGFFTTGDAIVPGNLGLWDQHLAIKWVHHNIGAFRGDTSRVTIFGESAGSASVLFQSIYPGNKGLFQRIIAESAGMSKSWAYVHQAEAVKVSKEFASLLGCTQATSKELKACMDAIQVDKLSDVISSSYFKQGVPPAKPAIDYDFILDDPSAVLSGRSRVKEVVDMFKSVDLIMGANSREAFVNWSEIAALLNKSSDDIASKGITKSDFDTVLVPHYLEQTLKSTVPSVAKQMTSHVYSDWQDVDDDMARVESIVDIVTDFYYNIPAMETAVAHSLYYNSSRSTYVYKFSTRPLQHLLYVPDTFDGPTVASHADELWFFTNGLLDTNNKSDQRYDDTRRVSKLMVNMWSNFAKSGNPNTPIDVTMYTNTVWPQYGNDENYLEITPYMTSRSVQQSLSPVAWQLLKNVLPEITKTL